MNEIHRREADLQELLKEHEQLRTEIIQNGNLVL